ncbi:hypothetical protein Ahy_A04g019511 [Arachis hypogaea]|uniref:Uncharacterized protein n=1 Tax=Arachis hypogaea TaxID=3818 RepID=A0A445DG34_ARAHY|nr:hypothetical protein Ahy_A04g019511 [Arachis hypogaea]
MGASEGVVAYHSGHFEKARVASTSAKEKFSRLQVSDGTLSAVIQIFEKEVVAEALRRNENDSASSSSSSDSKRDVEMEAEISANISSSDALADYDIEVNIKGEAKTQYLTMLDSAPLQ